MKRHFVYFTVVFALVTLTFGPRPAHAGNAVVGNGTPASCTEAAFDTALASIQADSYRRGDELQLWRRTAHD